LAESDGIFGAGGVILAGQEAPVFSSAYSSDRSKAETSLVRYYLKDLGVARRVLGGGSMISSLTRLAAILLLACTVGSPAWAVTTYAKFYSGGAGYTGPFNGAGTVYSNTSGLGINCPSAGSCVADNLASPQTYTGLPITATASGAAGSLVWDDISPNFGGLGVGNGTPSNDDQVAGTDRLTLTFSSQVTLKGVGTLFADAHTPFGASFLTPGSITDSLVFRLSVDGGAFADVKFSDANSILLSLLGTTFAFEEKAGNPEFYVSALAWESCGPQGAGCSPPPGTPIPGALPLFATGLGTLGLLGWRRKRKAAAA
jgi:hypothetical protein